jgi:hypothetical protein
MRKKKPSESGAADRPAGRGGANRGKQRDGGFGGNNYAGDDGFGEDAMMTTMTMSGIGTTSDVARVTNRDAQRARVRWREARWCWRRWDLTINMMCGGERELVEGKRRRQQLKKGRCRAGKDQGETVAGGGRLQSLRGKSRVFICMDAPPHTTKFQDLPRHMTMADPPLHSQEVSGEGKPILLIPKQMGMHMPPWGARCIRVKIGIQWASAKTGMS